MARKQHHAVGIGASAGGFAAAKRLLGSLPADFPAPIFLIIHLPARRSILDAMLRDAGPLPVAFAEEGQEIEGGRVYVAPPDNHLLVENGRVQVRRGPIENNCRPAIDPLFRSLGIAYGSGAIGVILTGMLSDGTAGLKAIKRCGGTAVVQDPAEAEFPEMPRNALAGGAVDHVVWLRDMASLLERLARRPPGLRAEAPGDIVLETRIAREQLADVDIPEQLGERSLLTCPDCQGALWELSDGDLTRYRCHVGHAYSQDALEEAQISELDRALGSALRVIDERKHVLRKLASEARDRQRERIARRWEERVTEFDRQGALIREALMARKISGNAPEGEI